MKTCPQCKAAKPFADFHKDKHAFDGHRTYCKACTKARKNAYDVGNREKQRLASQQYREKNRETLQTRAVTPEHKALRKRQSAEHYQRHKEKISARNKAWKLENPTWTHENYMANREHRIALTKKWNRANRAARQVMWTRRRARQINAPGSHSKQDIAEIFSLQRGKCPVCRASIRKQYHIDHVVALANGGSNDKCNIQLLCPPCNLRKGAKDPAKFMQENQFLL